MRRSVWICLLCTLALVTGCTYIGGQYPVNATLEKFDPNYGYIAQNLGPAGHSEELLLILSFSGGGTRAAAFSYGILEELRGVEITFDGKKRRLVDEVDMISGVSGGSFTAAYFGLFGDRIFEDYETRFLKKNVQGDLTFGILFNPVNWVRLSSPFYDRSDLAAEYYDKNVFDGKTFGDMLERRGPVVLINATDMSLGARFTFHQILFNAICSDLSKFPVARACAASSAVPGVLTPLTVKNYAGSCGFVSPPVFEEASLNYRTREQKESLALVLDKEKKPYFHLIDGGVADNLGLRAIQESIDAVGNIWMILKLTGREQVRKVVFVVVNAETKTESQWDKFEFVPPFSAMMSNYSTIAIVRYNRETMSLLQESFGRWSDQIRTGRCPPGQVSTEPGSCGDIEFYLVDVRFENLNDQAEAAYLAKLPTSFTLPPEDVDRLKAGARKLLIESADFQRLLKNLNAWVPSKVSSQ
ncbi:MAG TPA: patatin-like phospholipase family protein [Syntrophales bacterium]|nr:patatin-like phospholipase family protein [Syntrophales bacterium]HOX93212.1 patatin-like phospholipase family protein [Syntrophales bacterium]HPI57609.1 patatin-like phospholipase family protein [Syntrophales bacterium]HPN25378.1 patatin-like phospholipase family protein [Syntrophales bacterium]HQM29670.1 patatin-like phospholipase family protein [Syntrophales bacterium]